MVRSRIRYLVAVEILEENLDRAPTVREIAKSVGVSKTAAGAMMKRLTIDNLVKGSRVGIFYRKGTHLVRAYSLTEGGTILLGSPMLSILSAPGV